jgi:hypothetical protein
LDILSDRGYTFPIDTEASRARLRFGGVDIGEKGERAAFGIADEVTELKKGKAYM